MYAFFSENIQINVNRNTAKKQIFVYIHDGTEKTRQANSPFSVRSCKITTAKAAHE